MLKILSSRILMQLALFILLPYALFSKPISLEEAKEIAMQHNLQMNKYSTELQDPSVYKLIASSNDIFSKSAENPTFYIYNLPKKGWIIVAGDDIARPILAYSKEDSYSLENLHDNAKYWLEIYDIAISEAIKQETPQSEKIADEWLIARNPKKRTSLLAEVVPPLIKTKWGQEAPYNDLCPYDEDAKKRTITGCVATTMAQIMKYWNFPVSGKGKYTYGHGLYGKLSADFENTTYDWDNMTNEYNQNSSKEEIKAVATLMYHCGVALSMHYGVETSGTEEHYIVSSLKTYFMYDNSIKLIHRSNYNSTWTDILKENLDNNQPMPYAGEANAIRHSFICDGYDTDGRFHFNLGWNGNSNGYYYIDGITNLELNFKQNAIIDIKPIKELNSQVSLVKPLELKQEIVYQNSSIKINANIVNKKAESFSGSLSLRLFDAEDNFLMTVAEQEIDNLEPNKPIEITFETDPLFTISAGKYYVKLYHKHDILKRWLLSSGHNKLVLDVKKTNTGSKLSLYSSPILSAYQIEKYSTLTATASFINTSEEDFTGIISASIYDEKGNMIKELASYNVTEAIAPNNHIKDIEFSNTISDLEHGTIYFIGFSSKEKSGEFALVNTNGFISFIKFEILPPELIIDSQLKKWISDNKKQLFGVVVNEDGGIDSTKANLEALAKIENLNCSNSKLVSIDELIRHMPNLKTLKCYRNSLIELDVSKNIKLEELDCSDNQLKNLDVSNSIELIYLKCNHNQLINLDINNNIKLEALHCFNNQLNNLDVTNNIKLVELGCFENKLTNLYVSKNIKLATLHCFNNQLSNLDLSKNIKLEELKCFNNQLNNLDITPLTILTKLNCCNQVKGFMLYLTNEQKNKFTEKNYCDAILLSDELITDLQLKKWIKSNRYKLPEVLINKDGGIYNTITNLEALAKIEILECSNSSSLVSIDELIKHMPNLKILKCDYNSLINLDVSKNIKLEELHCFNNQLTNLDVTSNINLIQLGCFDNQLTSLDVSKNINIESLHCFNNQLTNLDVSKNIKLIELYFSDNRLTSLDITNNINLITLSCSHNQLIELDVSNNIELKILSCSHNQLIELDVSKNIKLSGLNCSYNQLTSLDISSITSLLMLKCCIQAEGFIIYLNNKQKKIFSYRNYCNAIAKEKDGSIREIEWLDIYPNPTTGKFFIESKFFSDEIKMFNVAGEVLYSKTLNAEKTEIDISNLPAGVYLVKTKGKIGKVVKN